MGWGYRPVGPGWFKAGSQDIRKLGLTAQGMSSRLHLFADDRAA